MPRRNKVKNPGRYDFQAAEKKWHIAWQREGVYEPSIRAAKKPFYNLMMFPYPSAEGLHVGNMYAFTGSDVYGRFMRMQGRDVFEPIGLDGFGIHSENYAMKVGTHPAKQAKVSEKRFYEQLQAVGNGFAWKEHLETYDSEYYKWTQWIFTQLFKAGLAYRKKQAVNWCPKDQTVLADEQVEGGKCERCGAVVEKRELEQWFFRITNYAERLLQNTEKLDWTEKVRIAQRNWIGKSEGAEIDFPLSFGAYSGDVVFATNNLSKRDRLQRFFEFAGLKIRLRLPKEIGVDDFYVDESEATIHENSEKKARALYGKTNLPILGEDSSLAIAGVNIDPVKVKRNALKGENEKKLSQEQIAERMLAYYRRIAVDHGGSVEAEWRNDHCLLTPEGFTMHAEAVRPITIMAKGGGRIDPYFPLRHLYVPKPTGKYAELQTQEEELLELQPITDALKKLFTPALKVFTTRPDTLFGATYLVLAPEHPFVTAALQKPDLIKNKKEVADYVRAAGKKSEEERVAEAKDKTGVEIKGFKAINPATKEEIPIWVADYVLGGYGTGAIMAVPAHDERDAEFAKKYELPVREVVIPFVGEELPNMVRRDAAKGVIIRDGQVLLVQQTNGEFALPGGGYEEGEGARETIVREIREETGYNQVSVKEFLGEIETAYPMQSKPGNRIRRVTAYKVDIGSSSHNKIESEEGSLSSWFSIPEGLKKIQSGVFKGESIFILRALGEEPLQYFGSGLLINSEKFNGMDSEQAKWEIVGSVGGERKVQYRLRDWLISRQRYWGPPIPMVFCETCAKAGKGERRDMPGWYAVPDKDLPVKLPLVKDFRPQGTGQSPLASVKSFYETKCPGCGSKARRETDVSDTFLDSAWYYLRYPSVKENKRAWDPTTVKKWFPVDMYIGGAEHSVLHLLYVRFLALALHDMKLLSFPEKGGAPAGEPFPTFRAHGLIIKEGAKMSKSKGNVVNPDEYIQKFGADTLRMYLMFLAPFEQGGDFRDQAVPGISRFLERTHRFVNMPQDPRAKASAEEKKIIHQTIKKVTADIASLHYNTAISALMICLNGLEELGGSSKATKEIFVKLLAPLAPYLSEELWRGVLGHKGSVHKEMWPKYDERQAVEKNITLVIQVNGKTRATIEAAAGITDAEARELALADPKVQAALQGQAPRRVIYVPGRLINIVV